ncbi:MAG: hypothetical protein KDK34_04465 [Leptospiraceae bacterium]|nr:hypothetical protein [Leptospiraceae bacterium]
MKKSNPIVRYTLLTLGLAMLVGLSSPTEAFSVAEKAQAKRMELIGYMRALKPMVYNYPCDPFPACMEDLANQEEGIEAGERIKLFNEIQRVYQEGLIYFYEGNYINSYNRMLDCQSRVESLLEGLSQFYLDRTEMMMRDAIEVKNENDPDDMTVTDISVDYGPNSRKRMDFADDREAPTTSRRYDPKELRWARNKYRIERNMEQGYKVLGLARVARDRAIQVDKDLRAGQEISPDMRKDRIEYYLASIRLCRMAKFNAAFIYQLKYPYDNYALHNHNGTTEDGMFEPVETPTIANVQMNWYDNPYLLPKNLHPVFDLRVPEQYRRDTADARDMIYEDELDIYVRLQYLREKPESYQETNTGGGNNNNQGGGGN